MKAIYNCVADNPDELTFTEGEVIVVDGEEDQEWWVSNFACVCVCAVELAFMSKKKDKGGQDLEQRAQEKGDG